jgi:DNA-binding FadR family transcriptional regulator
MSVGERLPSEIKLAQMFDVSRSVIRETLVRLASDGITEARRGAGSFVRSRPSDRLIAYTTRSRLSAALGTYEVRFALETEAARIAAARRSAQDMQRIEESLEALCAALLSDAPAHDHDMELHRRIVIATANPAFLAAFEALSYEVDKTMHAGVDISRSYQPQVIGNMMREHEAIVSAIRVHDSDGAALAMRWHLSEGRKRLMP